MTWYQTTACILIGVALYRMGLREWRLYRLFRNSSRGLREGPKKGPPQDEGTGIEYGGHHLP